jgi:hypothetical protein
MVMPILRQKQAIHQAAPRNVANRRGRAAGLVYAASQRITRNVKKPMR